VGVLAAGAVIALTGFRAADPLFALVIAVLVAGSAWPLIRDAVRVLLENAPSGIDPAVIGARLCAEPGVAEVHDLHVWTITSGFDALAVHVVATSDTDTHALLHRLEEVCRASFGIKHTTIQVDTDHSAPLRPLSRVRGRTAPLHDPHLGGPT
jgi:cobalt-zinc-cadmium efflux system protein